MSIIKRLEDAAIYGPIPCPVAKEAADLLNEIRDYMQCVIDQSMSRNNAENLAAEFIDRIDV